MSFRWSILVLFAGISILVAPAYAAAPPASLQQFINANCLECHDKTTSSGGLALDGLKVTQLGQDLPAWEKVVRKLASRQMPPKDAARPSETDYQAATTSLQSALDEHAAANPNPGRSETFRRLTRTEYQNTIRDLLDLEIDATSLLPADELSHGFDNITITDLSPSLLGRYVSAAKKISRLAVGRAPRAPGGETFRVRPDVTQDGHLDGLPLGTRGGAAISYHFPQDGEYEIQIHLMRDRNEGVEGLRDSHEMEIALDRQRIEVLNVKPPPRGQSDQTIDANLKTRAKITAGPHQLTVAFVKKPSSLLETERQPLNVHFNFYRHPRLGPAIYEVAIIGPFAPAGPGDTPSRRRLFVAEPSTPADEDECAAKILASITRRAYRRPVTDDDLQVPLAMYRQGKAEGGFELGIEEALSAILVNPNFLFRIERDPLAKTASGVYPLSDLELASRLSYFLWSSMPDEELLATAERGALKNPSELEKQVRRMLADSRSESLVTNFASQWLYLRNLDSIIPDMRLFPDFDDNLRQSLKRETELLFESIVREDRSVLDLLRARYTFLNERLAKHYEIPHVFGSEFRRVNLDDATHRGGLLRHGSILTVTSYATRTSPVIRGHWILKNLIGEPPPPPPPNVPALDDNTVSAILPVRERLKEHRANPACASCHELMDPVGFGLDNFDAIGRWRDREGGQAIDAAGSLPDGSQFADLAGLEQALLKRPELFAQTLTEKLLTFALGRGVEFYDAPAIRKIVNDAAADDHRFSNLVLGIVRSTPFQMRKSP